MADLEAMQDEIATLTLNVARPLIWHDRTLGWPKQLDGATCFFLKFDCGIVGVTANHVVSALERAVLLNPNTVCQLRNSPSFDLRSSIIARDVDRDIATFAVPEPVLQQIGAIPLDCRGIWPPPEPQCGKALSMCGYPETMRTSQADRSAEFRGWGALAVIEHVTANEILITYDPAVAKPTRWAPLLPPVGFNLSGCSGGPVLMHGTRNGIHRWFPVGLIHAGPRGEKKEGASKEFDMIRLQRIHVIETDGTINKKHEDTGWLPK